jgi:hypothetical protein
MFCPPSNEFIRCYSYLSPPSNEFIRCYSYLSPRSNEFIRCYSYLSPRSNEFIRCYSYLSPRSNEFIRCYSYLRASIGSRPAAFLAGHTPKIKPIPADTTNPVITAHMGIEAGSAGKIIPII